VRDVEQSLRDAAQEDTGDGRVSSGPHDDEIGTGFARDLADRLDVRLSRDPGSEHLFDHVDRVQSRMFAARELEGVLERSIGVFGAVGRPDYVGEHRKPRFDDWC
jgi:hypothetical protein